MDYICLTYDAIKEITSIHQLQSPDYDEALELCDAIHGNTSSWQLGLILFSKEDNVGYFFTSKSNFKKGLLFDLATFSGFKAKKNDQSITIFQKVLKFAIRYFEKLPPSTCEKHIAGTNTSIVFPFPFIATKESFRILIDKNLENRRLERREMQFLIVYASGYSDIINVNPDLQNTNKIIEESQSCCLRRLRQTETTVSNIEIPSFKLTLLNQKPDLSITDNIGFDHWQHYLTNSQKSFITKSVSGPERIEGAAGTGKTLSLVLRCIYLLLSNEKENQEAHILFITHSIATKKQITEILKANLPDSERFFDRSHSITSVTITTLQEWCIEFLGTDLGTTEYLDKDAQDAKLLQKMYLEDAFSKAMATELGSFKHFCSSEFISFIETTPKDELLEMLQHEVSVTIKGRANESLEKYKNLPRLKHSIPCIKLGDLNFLFLIFRNYQDSLQKVNQFDSDDIILTALGQLDTPIWRRRRQKDGYNIVFVDETHLFNLNELSIIHNLAKEQFKNNIIFTLDRSQAIGDRGLVDEALYDALQLENTANSSQTLDTIFRSSPDIINVAFNILSSGATLFTNFENPLQKVSSSFIEKDEKKAQTPIYLLKENEENMIQEAVNQAERIKRDLQTTNSKVLIVVTSEILFNKFEKLATETHKPIEFLKSRGDIETVSAATKNNRFVLAGIDYVGGLEFDGVVICGVDKGRVPPSNTETISESFHFTNYSWHNRMYVAVTRAKYTIVFIGEKSRGISPLLESSIENKSVRLE